MTEEWRPVRGYEDTYQVSNQGTVRSVERYVRGKKYPLTGEYSRRKLQGKVLSPRTRPDGILAVNLWSKNKYRQFRVRRLVLDAFDGPQPHGFDAANIDGDHTNNRLENLEWRQMSFRGYRSQR